MSEWIVYSKDGLTEKCRVKNLQYEGEFMGVCSLTVNISSPSPVNFELGDYMEYRGERFEINYDPSVVKQSAIETDGEGFVYESVVFNSLSDELTRCDFLDYVAYDNELHYSSLPNFSFFADNISKLAERIQVNLDRIYTGSKKWTVNVHPEYVNTLNVNIQANNNTVWDALGFVNSKFGANFIIRGRTITIGTTGVAVGNVFSYGKGNGLYKIERNAESSQKIITRLRAYGSTRNMPTDYYKNVEGGDVPNNMAVKNLMLPSFPVSTHDPYIDSDNIAELGIREGTVFFDGSGDLEEIYPTMEGMTAEDLAEAGITVNATGALDEVLSAEQITDNGVFEPAEGETSVTIPTFTITLKDVGFDINDYLSTSSATISMKDGMCGGRDFEIVSCEKSGSNYVLTCNRHYDESLDLYFPYNDYQIKGGDKFVLLNIEMPDVYIMAASERLLKAAKAYLAKNDYVRYSYTLTVDNVFMARQHDEAVKNGGNSIHDTIKEGDLIVFEDEDLGINGSVTISSLSIKEDMESSLIPEYEITLKDEKTVGSIEKIQNQITSILAGGIGSGTELNTEQLRSLIELYGSKIFLRKDKDDRSKGKISTDKALEVGKFVAGASGAIIQVDANNGQTIAELDKLYVRMKAYFETLEIINVNSIGGKMILSPAGSVTCLGVEELDDAYRCYFLGEQDGEIIENRWVEGMQAYSQMFNAKEGVSNKVSNTYYWRLVTGVSDDTVEYNNQKCHYIDLSKTDCDSGSDIPKAGDVINHRGCRNDVDYMNFIEFSSVGTNAPYITLFQGVDSYSLTNKEYVSFGYDQSTGRAYMNVYGDMFFGNRDESSYIKYNPTDGLEVKGKLSVGTTYNGSEIGALFDKQQEDLEKFTEAVTKEFENIRNEMDGAIDTWFGEEQPTLGNYPAVDWTTNEMKDSHLGDLFYTNDGKAYRFQYTDADGYYWAAIEDSEVVKALELAQKALDTADGKRRVFIEQPYPPYDLGDLWAAGESQPLKRCINARESGSYYESDWALADDTHSYADAIKKDLEESINTTKSELDQAIANAEAAAKDYTDEGKAEVQASIDAVNKAKADLEDVYTKAQADEIITKAEQDAINEANAVALAQRELLEARVNAYADGVADDAEKAAIADAEAKVEAAKQELHASITATKDELDQTIADTEEAMKDYTDEAKSVLQLSIDNLESSKANLSDVYDKAMVDGFISETEKYALDAAKAEAKAAQALAEETAKAYADGEITKEEEARIKQAAENLAAAKQYAEEKANEAFNNAMEEIAGYEYLKQALKEDTTIEGGLIQSSLIKLGYTGTSGYVVMAGSNGTLDTNLGDKSIAFWAGGDMLDRENGSNVSNAADFLVRMDGSGYAAGGNLSWDVTGKITADPMSFFVGEDTVSALLRAFTVTYNSSNVPTLITPNAPFANLTSNGAVTLKSTLGVTGATTLSSTLSVAGDLTAKSKVILGDIPMYKSQDGVVYIEGNLVVQGGITMYGTGSTDVPSIIDSLPTASTSSKGIAYFDSNYFSVSSDGKVSFIGATGGLDVTELQNYLTQNSYLNVTEGDGRYLKLSGGSISGSSADILNIKRSEGYPVISYYSNGSLMGRIGYNDKYSPVVQIGSEYKFILHSGNYSSYVLPLTGGTITVDKANGLRIIRTDSKYPAIAFYNNDTMLDDYIGFNPSREPVWFNSGGKVFKFWHEANDGSGSGLDADLLDGKQLSEILASNVESATKLQTARNFWGNAFDGTNDIKGNILINPSDGSDVSVTFVSGVLNDGLYDYKIGKFTDVNGVGGFGIALGFTDGSWTKFLSTTTDTNSHITGIRCLTEGASGEPMYRILSYPTSPYGLIIRQYSSGSVSLQSQREDDNAETFNLFLQPIGGNVGIGTLSAAYPLDVNGVSRSKFMYFGNETDGNIGFVGRGSGDDRIYLASYKQSYIHIYNNGSATEGITMNADANVGIGLTEPQYKLHVNGRIYTNTGVISAGAVNLAAAGQTSSFNTSYLLFNSGDARIGLNVNKDLGIYGGGNLYLRGGSTSSASSTGMLIESGGNVTVYSGKLIIPTTGTSAFESPQLFLGGSTRLGVNADGMFCMYARRMRFSSSSNVSATSEGIWINEGGLVGVNTNSPAYELHVEGTIYGNLIMKTPRTIWGQSFNGTNNVNGDFIVTNQDWIVRVDTIYELLAYNTTNKYFNIGYSTASRGYSTYLNGYDIKFRYGSSATLGMILNPSGNVGIGTTSPVEKLHVMGNLRLQPTDRSDVSISFVAELLGDGYYDFKIGKFTDANSKSNFGIAMNQSNGTWKKFFNITTGGNYDVQSVDILTGLNVSGSVGIGTTTPSYKLHVIGTMYASGATTLGSTLNVSGESTFNDEVWVSDQLNTYDIIPRATESYSCGYSGSRWYQVYSYIGNFSGAVTLGSTLSVGGTSTFSGLATFQSSVRLKDSTNYGQYLYFGDGSYCYIAEKADDVMTIYGGNGIALNTSSTSYNVSMNTNLLVSGGITMYNTSDQRKKKNIRAFNASQELMSLGGVYQFEYNDDEVEKNGIYKGTHVGLIYQNVKGTILDKMCYEREDGYGALNYLDSSFISLIAAVEIEHETRIQKLERENKLLREEVERLKAS